MMVTLKCSDYGFKCNFTTKSDSEDKTVEEFGKHSYDEHGIEYSESVLEKFIMRKLQ